MSLEFQRKESEEVIRVVPHIKASAAWNLAVEEALLQTSKEKKQKGEQIQPIVHLYSFNKPTVVLGHRQRLSEIDFPYCQEQGVHVTMRTTGGGSVFLSPEEMQYGLILPKRYTHDLLTTINKTLVSGFNDIGIQPQLVEKDGHDVVRHNGRGFVFDAQRRILVNGLEPGTYKHLLLHHGTILVDNTDYDHMPAALKANASDLETLQKGNIWLREQEQVKSQELIKSLNRNLASIGVRTKVADLTMDEYKLAQKLYHDYYAKPEQWSDGANHRGICYRTDTPYDMEQYAEEEES